MHESLTELNLEQVINNIRPNCQTIKWLDGGDNRFVILVDDTEVFRFPKQKGDIEAGQYEYAALELLDGQLAVAVPKPIELAADGSYNVLSYLPGKVISKKDATELSYDDRSNLGNAIAMVVNGLNTTLRKEDLLNLRSADQLNSNRDDYYAAAYQTACQQDSQYAQLYCQTYERIQQLRPDGFNTDTIIFGDFNPANIVLSDDNKLTGVMDWTGLGFGDIHRELRPVFAMVGSPAFDEVMQTIDPTLGPVDKELVRLCATEHELAILVTGKQKGQLTPARTELAMYLLDQWLPAGWNN